jgi:hypothetical protein
MAFLLWEAWALIGFLLIGGIIVSLILRKIKLFLSLFLVKISHSSCYITYLISHKKYNVPEAIQQGQDITYLPLTIGAIIFCFAILSIFINKLAGKSPNRPVRFRWIWFLVGVVIVSVGIFLSMGTLYAPKLFRYDSGPLPGLACLFWLPAITMASPIFYKVSRMNSDSHPNLMRYVVFLYTCASLLSGTMSLSLIMIYAILGTKISYIFWGALITVGFLPPSLIILGIAKDYLPLPPKISDG